MKLIKVLLLIISLSLLFSGTVWSNYINHDLKSEIFPEKQLIKVIDKISLPDDFDRDKIHFLLHGNLKIDSYSTNIKIKEIKGEIEAKFFGINTAEFKVSDKIPVKHYEVIIKKNATDKSGFELRYSGEIYHELKQIGAEYSRGFSETPGIISGKGVYLSGSTFWVPWFNENLVTFNIDVIAPKGWISVSQGKLITDIDKDGSHISKWSSPEPMDEVYLISAPFNKYKIRTHNVNLFAYMRTKDDNLAMKYLNTTGQYLEMYNNLIGQYPYSKFALIENFWETGYGMASFTLLGPKIIRFPFILHSSYPHELLHNWWGNSVFVDYEKGNWCEGITVFMADHLIKEQRGQGAEYRRSTLQGYTDYVNDENEFPVSKFKARYNASSSAIGYGKVMMMFNMLRRDLGDEVFIKSIQDFYKTNKFKKAEFKDIKTSFEKISGKDLADFFQQWVELKGAPELKIADGKIYNYKGKFKLEFKLAQLQKGDFFKLDIPVAIYLEGNKKVDQIKLLMDKRVQSYEYIFDQKPFRIEIDPEFDIFRRLSDEEIPPSLSKIFGSKNILIVISQNCGDEHKKAYLKLAKLWASQSKDSIKIVFDNELKKLPTDKSVWLLGWENKFKHVVAKQIVQYGCSVENGSIVVDEKEISRSKNSIILAAKNPKNISEVIVLLSSDNTKALDGLARKLPHYGKYSFLSFDGEEPNVNLKGQWESLHSPLIKVFNEFSKKGYSLKDRKALAKLKPLFSAKDMVERIKFLSDPERTGRGVGTPGLDVSAEYIRRKFKEYGLIPAGDSKSYYQEWDSKTGPKNENIRLKNIVGLIPGKKKEFEGQSVVICAHYDHLGLGWPDVRKGNEGKIHPGADDNASGISVLLELAKNLGKSLSPDRSILFVAFTGEESGLKGSEYFVNNYKKFPITKIIGVINLDTVGRLFGKKPMIIGANSAKEWKFMFMGIGYTTGVESNIISQELDASDQISFIKKGIPGIQIFSGPHLDYHKPTDTVDKIDPEGLVSIAKIARETLLYLSERKEPLTFISRKPEKKLKAVSKSSGKRASIGIMPDFTYNSNGVKVGMVINSDKSKKTVLEKGDIIVMLGGKKIKNLRDYSIELKKYSPGEKVEIEFIRNGNVIKEKIIMKER